MTRLAKALVFEGTPGQLKLCDWPLPTLNPGEILVRVLGSTICGSDLHSIHGRRQVPVPTILGHEIVGEVVEFGPHRPGTDWNGNPLEKGDRIVWGVVAHCGDCSPCAADLPQKCQKAIKYGHEAARPGCEWNGGFAEYCILVSGTTIIKLSNDMPLEVACPASCATATVCAGFEAAGSVLGKNVVITGAGLLGLTACAMAKYQGAARVIALDPNPQRREWAKAFGATDALTPQEFSDSAKTLPPIDHFLELSGSTSAFDSVWPSLATGGRVVLMGAVFPTPPISLSMETIIRKMLTLRGVHNYGPRHLSRAVKFLATTRQQFPFEKMVGAWFSLEESAQALEKAQEGSILRVGFRGPRR